MFSFWTTGGSVSIEKAMREYFDMQDILCKLYAIIGGAWAPRSALRRGGALSEPLDGKRLPSV